MKLHEEGVLNQSNIYLHTISETARHLYFYPLCIGHYFCDPNYLVNRSSYDSFLLLYVQKGRGFAYLGGRKVVLNEGSAVLLDCYQRHCYGTETGWEILWVHFDGVLARTYYSTIAQNGNCVFTPKDPYSIERNLAKIFGMYHEQHKVSEPLVNKYIVGILTEFLTSSSVAAEKQSGMMEELLAYISENIRQPLTLEALAKHASLSPYYFTRLFKKETKYTPHEYLILARVNAAKLYLKTTALPIKEIAFNCGFSSECNFCTTFKRITGCTPLVYRTDA